jgi:hypothetical protein
MSIAERRDADEARRLPKSNRGTGGSRTAQPASEVGELVRLWVGCKLDEVDALVDEARSKVDSIPDQRALWSLVGEVIVLLRALELEVAELKRGQG